MLADLQDSQLGGVRDARLILLPAAHPLHFLQVLQLLAQSPIPEQQQNFLSIIDDFADKAAKNEMAQGALRSQRAKAICGVLKESPEHTTASGSHPVKSKADRRIQWNLHQGR